MKIIQLTEEEISYLKEAINYYASLQEDKYLKIMNGELLGGEEMAHKIKVSNDSNYQSISSKLFGKVEGIGVKLDKILDHIEEVKKDAKEHQKKKEEEGKENLFYYFEGVIDACNDITHYVHRVNKLLKG